MCAKFHCLMPVAIGPTCKVVMANLVVGCVCAEYHG